MKFAWIVLLVSVFSAPVARAADSCIQQASNYDLINELSRRLGGAVPPTGGSVNVSFVCGGNAEVMATAVNLATGNSTRISTATGDWNRCRTTVDLLNTKLSGSSLSGGRLYAVCAGNAQVFKIAILVDGTLKQISADSTGDWNACYKTADQIDNALQP